MERFSSRTLISYIAIAQVIPFLLFPWTFSIQSIIFALFLLALSAVLGWALWAHKPWGRTLTIFTQGFNIIIRLITFFGNVYQSEQGFNWALMITYLLSIALSWLILSYVDRPEVQLIFES
ncbi:MAG: hypothetical protein JW934_22755 [Anaerolineae bacterium]|nr:hypothetical protein [Anaerolineae bacterium]